MSKGTEMRRSALLAVAALLFAFALQSGHLPGAWLFGPLVASALFAVRDWYAVELPRSVYIAAQAVVGSALGAGFSPATLLTLPRHLSVFAFAVVFILLTSLFNGWILTRSTRLDVATAFLGTMPGGAAEMAAMSDSLRADSRLVVIMQYTRLLLILASLALATPFLSHHSPPISVGESVTTGLSTAAYAWWKIVVLGLLASLGWLGECGRGYRPEHFSFQPLFISCWRSAGFNWAGGPGLSLRWPISSWDFRSVDGFAPPRLTRSRTFCFRWPEPPCYS